MGRQPAASCRARQRPPRPISHFWCSVVTVARDGKTRDSDCILVDYVSMISVRDDADGAGERGRMHLLLFYSFSDTTQAFFVGRA